MKRRFQFGGLTVILVIIVGPLFFLASKPKIPGLAQNNAVWCQSLFLRGYQPSTMAALTEEDLTRFCDTLNRNRIKYAYLFAGPYDTNGLLPTYAFSSTARASIEKIKENCPEVTLMPWVGGIVNKTVFVDESQWVSNAIHDTARLLTTLGLNGVHVNFEFFTHRISDEFFPGLRGIEDYGKYEVQFFKELRLALPRAFISTVVVSTAPQTKPWKRKNTFEEIRQMSELVNQIAILCYDTSISNQLVFQECYRRQLGDIKLWKNEQNVATEFLFGIGTFVNKEELWRFRELKIENISNTLRTLKHAMAESSDGTNLIDGLAIFAEWTTDEREWADLRQHWIER